MGSYEWAFMGLEPQAVSARVTKHFVTTFSKACNKISFVMHYLNSTLI